MAMTSEQVVDLILYRWGKPSNTVNARAEALRWANVAQRLLWSLEDWPFKREETILALTNTTQSYELSNDTAFVLNMRNPSGETMDMVPADTFLSTYLPDATTGQPQVYSLVSRTISGSEQKHKLYVWPTPVTAQGVGNATLYYEIALPDMTDSPSNYPRIPDAHRAVLATWALELYAAQQDNPQLTQTFAQERAESVAAMRRRYRLDRK